MIKTHNLGFPRIGEKRELKKATEKYWKNEISLEELNRVGKTIRRNNLELQKSYDIDLIPVNDFSYYDQMLDLSLLLGVIPERFLVKANEKDDLNLDLMFGMARGVKNTSLTASAMKKWFDTNYHYIVPELDDVKQFRSYSKKLFLEVEQALELGVEAKPVLISPVTYLKLSRFYKKENQNKDPMDLFPDLLNFYLLIIEKLVDMGVNWLQMDEPIFSTDLSIEEKKNILTTYEVITKRFKSLNIIVANYFGSLKDNSDLFMNLPVKAVHIDLMSVPSDIDLVLKNLSNKNLTLSLGVINGRNIWKNNFADSIKKVETIQEKFSNNEIMLAPSCSLIHSPISLDLEKKLDPKIKSWLSFAKEKLEELKLLKKIFNGEAVKDKIIEENNKVFEKRKNHPKVFDTAVNERLLSIKKKDYERKKDFKERILKQNKVLNLPSYPTTTIGSFPQTPEVRKMRAQLRKGEITLERYNDFIKEEIENAIKIQKNIGLDVYVHGEFERNDMVEYFGEQLEGFVFTQFGWVQSFGSRYVKPPIIFGSVSRKKPMTVEWTKFAADISDKPMKGMLTGPITILQWSFVRDDQERKKTATEIALALRDEINDLEENGIQCIQIDEPAIREGLPLRKKNWAEYLDWAVGCFKLATSSVKDSTQIHTHMCYSDFNDIIQAIADMDADVISIETSRSKMDLLDAFYKFNYPNQIGPGVYDIHSPRTPFVKEMVDLLEKAIKVLPRNSIWVNPDCGLKTRTWDDVVPALKNMVEAAKELRKVV